MAELVRAEKEISGWFPEQSEFSYFFSPPLPLPATSISVPLAPIYAQPKSEKRLERAESPTETLATQASGDVNLSLWPCVDIGEEKVDPLRDKRVAESLQEQDTEQCLLKPWSLVGEEEEEQKKRQKSYRPITTNTQEHFIIAENINEVLYLRVFDRTGNHFQTYRLPLPAKEMDDSVWSIEDIDRQRQQHFHIGQLGGCRGKLEESCEYLIQV